MKTESELIKQMRIEAANLKKHASKKQISKLDFNTLCPDNSMRCIYGQMTGDCYSPIASKLIKKCCLKTVTNYLSAKYNMEKARINGAPEFESDGKRVVMGTSVFHSPIELFITTTSSANIKNLIDYLQDKTKRLIIKE